MRKLLMVQDSYPLFCGWPSKMLTLQLWRSDLCIPKKVSLHRIVPHENSGLWTLLGVFPYGGWCFWVDLKDTTWSTIFYCQILRRVTSSQPTNTLYLVVGICWWFWKLTLRSPVSLSVKRHSSTWHALPYSLIAKMLFLIASTCQVLELHALCVVQPLYSLRAN